MNLSKSLLFTRMSFDNLYAFKSPRFIHRLTVIGETLNNFDICVGDKYSSIILLYSILYNIVNWILKFLDIKFTFSLNIPSSFSKPN